MEVVAGVDGAPGGWAIARCADGHVDLSFARDLTALVHHLDTGPPGCVAIDMPIGLPGDRSCDFQARRLLGPRRSSVFAPPHRSVLAAADYADAKRLMIAATGKSLSIQAYNLIPKIAEVDSLLVSEERRRHIVEAHPELAFMRLYGSPLPHPKKSTAGAKLRTELLGQRFGVSEVDDLLANRTMPVEDALDALVLLVTAQHLRAGTAALLGDGRADAEDRPVRMAY